MSPQRSSRPTMRFNSKAKACEYPQQSLRDGAPLFAIDDEGMCDADAVGAGEEVGLFLASLRGLEDDYGSYATIVTPANASDAEASADLGTYRFDESNNKSLSERQPPASEVPVVVQRGHDYLRSLGPRKLAKIKRKLTKRIIGIGKAPSATKQGGRGGAQKPVTPSKKGARNCSNSSQSCVSSTAETEVWHNLTRRFVRAEVISPFDGDHSAEAEAWNKLASTFVAKEESIVESCDTNSLCEAGDADSAIEKEAFATVGGRACEGVEVEYNSQISSARAEHSLASDPLSSSKGTVASSSHSSMASSSSGSSSFTSTGILKEPKLGLGLRAVGGYDPFGNSDFTFPGRKQPKRRVKFLNMDEVNKQSGQSGVLSDDSSDDSTSSFEYLSHWCGVDIAAEGFEEV